MEKKAGNLDEAEALLGRAMRAWPESTRVLLSAAELHELRGDRCVVLARLEMLPPHLCRLTSKHTNPPLYCPGRCVLGPPGNASCV